MAFIVASELQSSPRHRFGDLFSYARGCVLRDEANVLRPFLLKAFFVLRSMRSDAEVFSVISSKSIEVELCLEKSNIQFISSQD